MRARFAPIRAALLALAASLLAHAVLLGGGRSPASHDAVRPARAVSLASLPPLPPGQPAPEAAEAPPRATPGPARPGKAIPLPAAPATAAAADTPPLRLAGPAAWHYRLRQNGQDGEARLDWQPQPDGRYSLRLSKRIGDRALPDLESLGRAGSTGLAPERFALQRNGQDRQAVNFDAEERNISFSASPAQHELPEGVQDRLSWWLQLAVLVQSSTARPAAPGTRWRIWVAGLRGELREWTFEVAEPALEDAGTLHLRRLPLGPHDPGIEVWLAPARDYWPVRLRQGDPETRGYEIVISDVNS
jgi:hypothetical protein